MSEYVKYKLTVHISNITVSLNSFKFKYKVWRNGKIVRNSFYIGSHRRSATYMRERLKEGYAMDLVLEIL